MIVTTTPSIEGRRITDYGGIVFGEVITGINVVRDMAASLRDIFGGRARAYEEELARAREDAIAEMAQRAQDIGADAVVGVKLDCEALGTGGMLMVTASGTAVRLDEGE